ncbi:MAG: VOC family protein [Pseudomonadota bacterium]
MKPTYFELGVPDEAQAQSFFAALFGWDYTAMDEGGWFDAGGLRVGLHGKDDRPALVVYFEVPDIEAAVAKVRALGGTAHAPTAAVPDFGRFSNCTDPQGVHFGLRQVS